MFDIMDSLRGYNGMGAGTGFLAKWTDVGLGAGDLITATTPWGAPLLRTNNGSGTQDAYRRVRGANRTSFCDGFWFKFVDLGGAALGGAASSAFWLAMDVSTAQLRLALRNDGALLFYVGTTLVETSAAGVIVENTLVHIQIKGVIDAVNGSYEVKVGNTVVLGQSGIDTQQTANAYVTAVQFMCPDGSGGAGDAYFGEIFCWSDDTYQGQLRSERRALTASPTEAWTPSTGTDNYAVIDEDPVSTVDYVDASANGTEDRYSLAAMTAGMQRCAAIRLYAFGRCTDSVPREINLQCVSNGTVGDGANLVLPATTGLVERYVETDPDTAAAWTVSGGENASIGLKLAA